MANRLRNYLHPILTDQINDYVDNSSFNIDISASIDDDASRDSVSVSFAATLDNEYLHKMLKNGDIELMLDVYCSETFFRYVLRGQELSGAFNLQPGRVFGNLQIETSLIASRDIADFSPVGINGEYAGMSFQVEESSPLAVATTYVFPISYARYSLKDLIRVQTSLDLDPNTYEINLDSNFITILMGKNARVAWNVFSSDPLLKPHLYMSFYKDTFVQALAAISASDDLEEFVWAQRFRERFEKEGIRISEGSDFSEINSAVLTLLGVRGIQKVAEDANS